MALGAVLVLYGAVSLIGITWGLPSRKIDKYLFGGGEVWSGEKIYRLAKADRKFSPTLGADVDVDPITKNRASLPSPRPSPLKGEGEGQPSSPQPSPLKGEGDKPIPLTATEEDVAKIYLRYRLYTYQPDEMITMMALAGMRPSRLDLDPRLYQYGGLFIYPVGALIKLCGLLGLIDVRSDVVFYLDHPDEFGKFYIVARAYSAAWGLIGVLVVYAITRRIVGFRAPSASERSTATTVGPVPKSGPLPHGRGSDPAHRTGLLAALLFTLIPVVVCMSHEGKPHLPGAVLMLLAVYFAMRCAEAGDAKREARRSKIEAERTGSETPNRQSAIDNRQSFRWMCVCCGAALGMVLSSWPIFVLIPLVAFRAAGLRPRARLAHTIKGVAIGLAVYLVTNPYVLINAFINREVLRSNFGNSLAMYEIARIGEGFLRVIELTIEGATPPILIVGLVALVLALLHKNKAAIALIVVAALFFLQFVLIGAGKPAEYGRFGIFSNTGLAIGAGVVLESVRRYIPLFLGYVFTGVVILVVAMFGAAYLLNFHLDATGNGSRTHFAGALADLNSKLEDGGGASIALFREPAPYSCPPLNFARTNVFIARTMPQIYWALMNPRTVFVQPTDDNPGSGHAANTTLSYPKWLQALTEATSISWANKPFAVDVNDPTPGVRTLIIPPEQPPRF